MTNFKNGKKTGQNWSTYSFTITQQKLTAANGFLPKENLPTNNKAYTPPLFHETHNS